MAKRPSTTDAPQPATLSADEMRAALPQLAKRIDELSAFNVASISEESGDSAVVALETKINDTINRIYGPSTIEAGTYRAFNLIGMYVSPNGRPSFGSRRLQIQKNITRSISTLTVAVEMLGERLEGVGGSRNSIRAYEGLDLHPEIAKAATGLYKNGHYSNAVEAAVKRLNGLVRLRSDLEGDGATLMERAFNPTNPVVPFNDLSNQSDRDEQKGFMMLFSGAVAGLRNPRAHGFIQDDPERALEFIAFVSLLAKLLDEAAERSP